MWKSSRDISRDHMVVLAVRPAVFKDLCVELQIIADERLPYLASEDHRHLTLGDLALQFWLCVELAILDCGQVNLRPAVELLLGVSVGKVVEEFAGSLQVLL